MASFDELLERIEVLEKRTLTLKDLPLAPLQRKLEQDWRPSGAILLGENSITAEMLAFQTFEPVYITPVSLFTHSNGTVTWATKSIASDTGTATARFAIVKAAVGGTRTSAVYASNLLRFRKTGTSGPYQECEHVQAGTGAAGSGGGHSEHLIVPLDASEQFDYERVDGMASSSFFRADLEGYIT